MLIETRKGEMIDSRTLPEPCVAPHRSRKDRRHWCRGKIGVQHQPVWQQWKEHAYLYTRAPENIPLVYKCTNCGKHLDYWYAYWDAGKKPRPVEGLTEKPSGVLNENP